MALFGDPITLYVLIFIAGMAGSWHCVGMCGGFACALAPDPRGRGATLLRHLIYNTGRLTTYCFLGALVGYLGATFVAHGGGGNPVGAAQRVLAVVSGLLMVFIGLQFFGYFQRFSRTPLIGFGGHFLVQALRDLLKAPGAAAPLAFGVVNGFLPCPLVYAFAAQAAASGGPLPGVLVMLAFGLGTFPAMLLMGGLGAWFRRDWRPQDVHTFPATLLRGAGAAVGLRPDWRRQVIHFAGLFIVGLGLITFARGVIPLTGHG